jgi:hypothetical protein
MANETLQVSKTDVLNEFNEAGKKTKASLTRIFGEKVFKGTIIERVKTLADAVEELGSGHPVVIENIFYPTDTKAVRAFKTLLIVTEALQEGVILDWNNSNQYKYEPRFIKNKSGFGFSGATYGHRVTDSGVGSRLYVDTAEKAKYLGTQFAPLYNDLS